jgi:dTDP-4-amino-4,6-dideoxygalactose transaminase
VVQSFQLAILGGRPAFDKPLHVGTPSLGDRAALLRRINDILDARLFTNHGPYVQEMERRVATITGARHCVVTCNGTMALQLAIRALELKGEIILPSFTFIATAHALLAENITPVFCDIDPTTHNLDASKVEPLITERTSAILGVHLWGRFCDVQRLRAIALRKNLKLLFDAAHAFGSYLPDKLATTSGDVDVFSFHATKIVSSFEGGAVITAHDEVAAKLRLMRNFGFAGYDNVVQWGLNAKMPEISAAMALTALDALPQLISHHQQLYETYRSALEHLPGVSTIRHDADRHPNYRYVVLDIDAGRAALTRDELLAVLQKENILARRYFWPGCHRASPYRELDPEAYLSLPHTEALVERVLVLPTGETIGTDDVNKTCAIIRSAFAQADDIRAALNHDDLANTAQ